MATVTGLFTYPIKGCAGSRLADAPLTPSGLEHDRTFMVVDDDGVFRSQRRDRRLALIEPTVAADGEQMVLRADGVDSLCVAVDVTGPRRDVRLFGTAYRGVDQGEDAAAWMSYVLRTPSRLVRVPPEHDRVTDGLTPGTSGFADSSPVHLTTVESLRELNHRLSQRGESPVPMSRFRPNIVVEGWGPAHLEDHARRLEIGGAELGYSKLAIRCVVTVVDQATGVKTGKEPLRTLADFRRARQGGVAFGVKLSVIRPGKVSVGDAVTVTSWGESEL